jgi:predicted nucleic acid-binding protein
LSDFVIDSSVILAWVFPDESNPYADNVLEMLGQATARAPNLCGLEVTNAILSAQRSNRIDEAAARANLSDFMDLPIFIESDPSIGILDDIWQIGNRLSITAYDAAYLELSNRLGLPFASLDRRLNEAATDLGVPILT